MELLEEKIRRGEFPPNSQLPAESALAESLNVSRVTLREALTKLEEQGLIRRQHGVGTFVNPTVPPITFQLEVNRALTQLLESTGHTPGLAEQKVEVVPAPEEIASALEVEPGYRVYVIERVRTADDRPVVFSSDYIPAWVVGDEDIQQFSGSLYGALHNRFHQAVEEGVAELRPAKLTGRVAKALKVPDGRLAMLIEQLDRNAEGRPILLSKEYYLCDTFRFLVHRRRRRWEETINGSTASP